MQSECCGPADYEILIEHFDRAKYEKKYLGRHDNPEGKARKYAFKPIAEAACTHEQLKQVANEVHKGGTYNYAFNNCQHFCLNIIERLHKLYPKSVTKKGVKDIFAMVESYPNITISSRQRIVIKDPPQAKQSEIASNHTADAPEKDCGIRKLFHSLSKPRVSRPTTEESGSSGDHHSASFEGSD